jgi:hypothetical protein
MIAKMYNFSDKTQMIFIVPTPNTFSCLSKNLLVKIHVREKICLYFEHQELDERSIPVGRNFHT